MNVPRPSTSEIAMRILMLLGLLCLSVPALAEPDPEAEAIPEVYVGSQPVLVLKIAEPEVLEPVASYYPQFMELMAITGQIQRWTKNSQNVASSSQDRIQKLEEQVTSLKKAVEELQNRQPGGTPGPATDDKRLAALEARVARLEEQQGSFKAPFKVVNAAGVALFAVAEDGRVTVGTDGQATIVMKATGADNALIQLSAASKKMLMLTDGGSGSKLQLNDGAEAAVELNASQGNNGFIRVAGGKSLAIINADPSNAATFNLQGGPDGGLALSSKPDNLGLLVQKAGKNAASLGAMPGKGVALRLFSDAGQQVVAAGSNPAKGGAGLVSVSAGDKAAAILTSEPDGAGLVQSFAADGTGAAALVGKERAAVAYNQAGNAVATISKSDKSEGGTVVARNPGGEGVFVGGYRADVGGGESCVYRAKAQNTFCLGIGMPGMGIGK